MTSARKTRDHNEIREWVEARDGRPTIVEAPHESGRPGGLLRIDFGDRDEGLEEVDWEEFFEIFDENDLVFLCQEETADGELCRFNKFVSAESD